jgi:HEAT repeat protein
MKKSENTKDNNISSFQATEIISELEKKVYDRRPIIYEIKKKASVKEIKKALQISKKNQTKCILCDILSAREARSAVAILLELLDSKSEDVKDCAGEALWHIGSIKAGESLLLHFQKDPRYWTAAALGVSKYYLSIPYLIGALKNSNWLVRSGSAMALGELEANEALLDLRNALAIENDPHCIDLMTEAIDFIEDSKSR